MVFSPFRVELVGQTLVVEMIGHVLKLEWVLAATKRVKGFVVEVDFDQAFDAFGAPVVLASRQDSIADTNFGITTDAVNPNNNVKTSIELD